MTFPLRFLRQIAGTIRGRSVLLAEIHQEVRALHESIGSLRALFLSEKLSRAEVGYDVVITPSEINNQHGTGFLVDRLFGNRSNVLSIRATNHYGGDHHFGDESLIISHERLSRSRSIEQTLRKLGDRIPKRIFCVPYLPDDLLTAITLRDVFKAPLCLYLMDDQNITTSAIPDSLMREFLEKCALRLTTHSEMREAYESKYGSKFYLLPAVVTRAPHFQLYFSARARAGPRANRGLNRLHLGTRVVRWLENCC